MEYGDHPFYLAQIGQRYARGTAVLVTLEGHMFSPPDRLIDGRSGLMPRMYLV
jgi:hypothetical protein